MLTGEPRSLDERYLGARTAVLKQPAAVQEAYIRQYVNQLTASCDRTEQAAQAATARRVSFSTACTQLGGSIASSDGTGAVPIAPPIAAHPNAWWVTDRYKKGDCVITYNIGQDLIYIIPLAPDGTLDGVKYAYNRDVRCKGYPKAFHSDTGVCVTVGWLS
jgi:hypothetical protein